MKKFERAPASEGITFGFFWTVGVGSCDSWIFSRGPTALKLDITPHVGDGNGFAENQTEEEIDA